MDISSVGDLKQQIAHVDTSTVRSVGVASTGKEGDSPPDDQIVQEASNREQIDDSVKKMNDFVQSIERNLSFSVDEETGHDVIRVVDSSTDELIRQIPSEEFLSMSKNLNEMSGLLFKESV